MTITVCVPVWNGADFVRETLESLCRQTLTDFRVLISIDRSDDDSVAVCEAYRSDPRFEIFVQPYRLGWVGNINALLSRVETPFACILPHDDVIASDYLERLVAHLESHPRALLAYSDIETFGLREERLADPELRGDPLNRIVTFLRSPWRAAAFRGVFRTRVLTRGHYLRPDARGHAADTLWLLALAAEGELVRVPETLYRKRIHAGAVTASRRNRPLLARGISWLERCLACHQTASRVANWTMRERLAITVATLVRAMAPLRPLVDRQRVRHC